MCAITEVENNLVAMGFEIASDSVVAQLPDSPLSVQQPSSNTRSAQVVHLREPTELLGFTIHSGHFR